jgi:ubiquinone/menaquinone biosynthesis C-methylase UbiE
MATEISRVNRTHRQAQRTYDQISRWYDLLEGYWEQKARAAALRHLNVAPGQQVLEIGPGPGHSLIALARAAAPSGQVCGLDLSSGMLHVARSKLGRAGLTLQPDLCCADAVQIPTASAVFDAVLMSFVLELFDTPEIPQVLSECHRVLRAGGRISVVALSKAGPHSRMRDLYEWGHVRFPQVLDCRPIFVQQSLEGAGFCTRQATRISLWGLPVEVLAAEKPKS